MRVSALLACLIAAAEADNVRANLARAYPRLISDAHQKAKRATSVQSLQHEIHRLIEADSMSLDVQALFEAILDHIWSSQGRILGHIGSSDDSRPPLQTQREGVGGGANPLPKGKKGVSRTHSQNHLRREG